MGIALGVPTAWTYNTSNRRNPAATEFSMADSNGKKPSLVLSIYNQHSDSCGPPPNLGNESPNVYIGYFENPFGEQWIFTFDRQHRTAILRGGDAGWENSYSVRVGVAEGLVLGSEEIEWLRACWKAVTKGS